MQLVMRCYDGHGNDWANGVGCDWLIMPLDAEWVEMMEKRHDLAKSLKESNPEFDEIRFFENRFSVYRDLAFFHDDDERDIFDLVEDDYAFLGDDLGLGEESRVECCVVAVDEIGNVQFHFLPRHLDGWIRTSCVSIIELKEALAKC